MCYPQLIVLNSSWQVKSTSTSSCECLTSWSWLLHSIFLTSSLLRILLYEANDLNCCCRLYDWYFCSSLFLCWFSESGQGSEVCSSCRFSIGLSWPPKQKLGRAVQCGTASYWLIFWENSLEILNIYIQWPLWKEVGWAFGCLQIWTAPTSPISLIGWLVQAISFKQDGNVLKICYNLLHFGNPLAEISILSPFVCKGAK